MELKVDNSEVVVRFVPTITTGKLHCGHIINLFANLFYAQQNHGKFFIVFDGLGLYGEQASLVSHNQSIVRYLLPGHEIIYHNVEESAYHRRVFIRLFGQKRFDELLNYGEHFYVVLMDFFLGTSIYIRGRDWLTEMVNLVSVEVLSDLREEDIPFYFHPLMVQNKFKICKSYGKESLSLDYWLRIRGISRLSLFVLCLFLFERINANEIESIVNLDVLANYHSIFSIDKLCEMSNFEWSEDTLLSIDELVKRKIKDHEKTYDDLIFVAKS